MSISSIVPYAFQQLGLGSQFGGTSQQSYPAASSAYGASGSQFNPLTYSPVQLQQMLGGGSPGMSLTGGLGSLLSIPGTGLPTSVMDPNYQQDQQDLTSFMSQPLGSDPYIQYALASGDSTVSSLLGQYNTMTSGGSASQSPYGGLTNASTAYNPYGYTASPTSVAAQALQSINSPYGNSFGYPSANSLSNLFGSGTSSSSSGLSSILPMFMMSMLGGGSSSSGSSSGLSSLLPMMMSMFSGGSSSNSSSSGFGSMLPMMLMMSMFGNNNSSSSSGSSSSSLSSLLPMFMMSMLGGGSSGL